MFDQGDVGLFLRVLNATELLSHREKVSGHLARVHQQHSPTGSRQTVSLVVMTEHAHKFTWEKMQTGCYGGGWRRGCEGTFLL